MIKRAMAPMRLGLAAMGLAALTAAPAAAQQLPGPAEPGRREAPVPPAPLKPVPLKWILKVPGGAEAPKHLADETIEFNGLVLDGVTAYPAGAFADLSAAERGTEITFGRLYAFARAVQARYHADGYLLSFAYIPPQEVSDGIYQVAVVEGFVDRVVVEDASPRLARTIEEVLAPLARERPLDVATLERALLLVNDLDGVTATGVLRPSKDKRGGADLFVKASHKPLRGSLVLDNRGSKYAGRKRLKADAAVQSLLGLGESLGASATVTPAESRELRSIDVIYRQPLGSGGLLFSAAAGFSSAIPGFTLDPQDVQTISRHLDLDLTYPIVRTRTFNFSVGAGFTMTSNSVDLGEGTAFSRDRIRAARASMVLSESGFGGGATAVRFDVMQGLPFLDPTDPDRISSIHPTPSFAAPSRADAKTSFTKFGLSVNRVQHLYEGWTAVITANGQASLSPLVASEEFAVGGGAFGRAYDDGEIIGDEGMALAIEVGRDFPINEFVVRTLHPYGFYDVGVIWDKKSASSAGKRDTLASAGFGLRASLDRGVSMGLELAFPLTRVPATADGATGPRFLFRLAGAF